jgi:RNA polymerase sigma-70 factor (ECF subfamily)
MMGSMQRAEPVATDRLFVDEATFRAWYEGALPRVYGYLLHRVGDSELAEELTQQAFVEAVRKRATFRGESEPTTWVIAIARRKLIDEFRRRDRRERGRLGLRVHEVAVEPTDNSMSAADSARDIQLALRQLPVLQRAAVVLCYVDGLSVREAGNHLGKSEGATESLLSRARAALRVSLSEDRHGR